jgi:hypothetical protein
MPASTLRYSFDNNMLILTTAKTKTLQADAAITNATNAAPIAITTQNAHNLETGDIVVVTGVNGNAAANGRFSVTVTGASSFTLDNSNGSGAYTNGGSASHIGWATAAQAIDNTVYPNGAQYTLQSQIEKLPVGSALRVHWQDATDGIFQSTLPGPTVAAQGPVNTPTMLSVTFAQFPALPVGQPGAKIRLLVYATGGPGTTFRFSSWVA